MVAKDKASTPQVLPNWDFLQRGYDVFFIDPTTLSQVDPVPPPSQSTPTGVRQYVLSMKPTTPCPGNNNYLMPAECSSNFINKFVESDSNSTAVMQVSSDIAQSLGGSISIGDPTGKVCSFSGSMATNSRRQQITDRSTAINSTQATYQFYELQIPSWNSSGTTVALTPDFLAAIQGLTASSDVRNNVIPTYGTHFATSVQFGGIASLNFSLTQSDLSTLTASGVALTAEGKASFDVVKVGGKISSATNISQAYKNAVSQQDQHLVYVGGSVSGSLSDWESSILASPAPINVVLQPLYALPQLKNAKGVTAQQLTYLQNGITAYLESPGYTLSSSILNYGDIVVLQPVSGIVPAGLNLVSQPGVQPGAAPKTNVQSAVAAPSGQDTILVDLPPGGTQLDAGRNGLSPTQPGETTPFLLTLVNPAKPGDTSQVDCNNPICFALNNSSPQLLLDAEAGGVNQGMVGLSANDVSVSTAQWTVYPLYAPSQPVAQTQALYATLAHASGVATDTTSLVHGDAVSIYRMESNNPNPRNPQGYLQNNGGPLFSNGTYTKAFTTGNNCFFRVLLVSKAKV